MTQESTAPPKSEASVNTITRKSRAVQPILNGNAVPRPSLLELRSKRPMIGLDIDRWRLERGLTKFQAESALGFRSTTLYNRETSKPVLPITTEILIRLYDELPEPPPWEKLTFPQLFELMYGKALSVFKGRDLERARVDLGARFTVMFGRSNTRAYAWLRSGEKGAKRSSSSYSDVECILAKLTAWTDPAATFERVAAYALKLRGVDIDELFPIPTLKNPPQRKSPGRKPGQKVKADAPAKKIKKAPVKKASAEKKSAGAKKAAKKAVPKKTSKPRAQEHASLA